MLLGLDTDAVKGEPLVLADVAPGRIDIGLHVHALGDALLMKQQHLVLPILVSSSETLKSRQSPSTSTLNKFKLLYRLNKNKHGKLIKQHSSVPCLSHLPVALQFPSQLRLQQNFQWLRHLWLLWLPHLTLGPLPWQEPSLYKDSLT